MERVKWRRVSKDRIVLCTTRDGMGSFTTWNSVGVYLFRQSKGRWRLRTPWADAKQVATQKEGKREGIVQFMLMRGLK
jgi:hypothetical protein